MAETARHAAEHNRYEVHELLGGEPALDLGRRFETSDFGAAVDYAFDYLERRDPRREGIVGALEIVRDRRFGARDGLELRPRSRARQTRGHDPGVGLRRHAFVEQPVSDARSARTSSQLLRNGDGP